MLSQEQKDKVMERLKDGGLPHLWGTLKDNILRQKEPSKIKMFCDIVDYGIEQTTTIVHDELHEKEEEIAQLKKDLATAMEYAQVKLDAEGDEPQTSPVVEQMTKKWSGVLEEEPPLPPTSSVSLENEFDDDGGDVPTKRGADAAVAVSCLAGAVAIAVVVWFFSNINKPLQETLMGQWEVLTINGKANNTDDRLFVNVDGKSFSMLGRTAPYEVVSDDGVVGVIRYDMDRFEQKYQSELERATKKYESQMKIYNQVLAQYTEEKFVHDTIQTAVAWYIKQKKEELEKSVPELRSDAIKHGGIIADIAVVQEYVLYKLNEGTIKLGTPPSDYIQQRLGTDPVMKMVASDRQRFRNLYVSIGDEEETIVNDLKARVRTKLVEEYGDKYQKLYIPILETEAPPAMDMAEPVMPTIQKEAPPEATIKYEEGIMTFKTGDSVVTLTRPETAK